MTRMRRGNRLNDAKSKVIEKEILKENPEDYSDELPESVVVMNHVPEYRSVTFLNGRDPGQALYFHYASATHPLKQYTLHHGFQYDLPVEIIEHIESCSEPQYAYRKSIDGHPEMFVCSKKFIFQLRNVPKKAA